MSRESKAQVKQRVEELKRRLTESERRLEEAQGARDELEESDDHLKEELALTQEKLDEAQQTLSDAREELAAVKERLTEGGTKGDLSRDGDPEVEVRESRDRLEEAIDLADPREWELDQLRSRMELEILKSKEEVRQVQRETHIKELKVRDDLIAMMKAKLKKVEGICPKPKIPKHKDDLRSISGGGCATLPSVTKGASSKPKGIGEEDSSDVGDKASAAKPKVMKDVSSKPKVTSEETGVRDKAPEPKRKVSLPALPQFSGDKPEGGEYKRWTKRFLRPAELENWTEREKLLQLELRLQGRAEELYEVLPVEDKSSFEKAVEALGRRLRPVKSEALVSAVLMRRKQKPTETVEEY